MADKIVEVENRVLETGEAITYEEIIPTADGSEQRSFMTTKTPLVNEAGEIYGICGIATDITEHKKSQEAMRLANAEQTAMFEATTLGIAFIRERVVVRGNSQLDALFGTAQLGQSPVPGMRPKKPSTRGSAKSTSSCRAVKSTTAKRNWCGPTARASGASSAVRPSTRATWARARCGCCWT